MGYLMVNCGLDVTTMSISLPEGLVEINNLKCIKADQKHWSDQLLLKGCLLLPVFIYVLLTSRTLDR